MTQHKFVKKIVSKSNGDFTQKDVRNFIRLFKDSVKEALIAEDDVKIKGFGTFKMVKRNPVTVTNPTGKKYKVPARKLSKFIFGRNLKVVRAL